jgi:hypothetical protein
MSISIFTLHRLLFLCDLYSQHLRPRHRPQPRHPPADRNRRIRPPTVDAVDASTRRCLCICPASKKSSFLWTGLVAIVLDLVAATLDLRAPLLKLVAVG